LLGATHTSVPLNIHVKLDKQSEAAAISFNQALTTKCPHQEIDLSRQQQPHVTLFLTEFARDSIDELKGRVEKAVATFPRGCSVELGDTAATGTYLMWHASLAVCLQSMSDAIVNATADLVDPSAKSNIPSWVKEISNTTEREAKEAAIRKYGSPNVFSQFQPHVTLGWSSNTSCLTAANAALHVRGYAAPRAFTVSEAAVGTVGAHGTVMRGQDLLDVGLNRTAMPRLQLACGMSCALGVTPECPAGCTCKGRQCQ
jgi:2'-5' RNA ligase